MRCTKCGTENAVGKKFCSQCGSGLPSRCPNCGTENPQASRFCGDCGAALVANAEPAATRSSQIGSIPPDIRVASEQPDNLATDGERKTVTALFADIKGSTELEQDLDPEEARAIVDPALKLMIDAVRRYDGYIVQSTGDGIFALFGAPVAHEDHPQRALYAGLRMQEELKRYSAKLVADGGMPIEARIGVNSGEVVVRSISTGGGHVEYTPIGHTTNLASRMQAVAPTGSIATSEQTRKLCEGYFTLKPLGPTKVKGVSEPVNVYEVTGLGPLRTRLQRSAGRGYTKFVGRQRELDAMKAAAELAKAVHGQIVAAMAEPGVGKSRLFYEFKAVSQSGWMVLEAFSVSHGKASAFLPVIDLLHGYFDVRSEDDARKRREKVAGKIVILDPTLNDALPYLYSLLGLAMEPDPLAQMDAQARKRRTLDAIKRILIRESLNQPLMVIFEDLHWIDDETQAFLNLLADSIGTAKILLLVNYRPEYSHQWGSKTYYTQLRLDPLGKESAEDMLSSLLGDGKDLIPLKRLIIERTEGNPFFMEETVEVLLDDGALVRNGTIKLVKPLAELKIPPTVQAILASRIDRLPPDQKDLLQTLAVIGREFPFGLIKSAVAKPHDELNRMLGDLQLAEFIYEQPAAGDIEYTFKHALTQEVAYQSVLVKRRKVLHQKIGAAIEGLASIQIDDHLAELAHHYGRSANTEKAVDYLDRAGLQAMTRGALKEAELYYKQAIAALSTTPETPERIQREFNLQYALWRVLTYTSGYSTADTAQASRRVRELGEKTGNPEQLFIVLSAAWTPAWGLADITAAQQIADQMLQIAERTGGSFALSVAHQDQGWSLSARGDIIGGSQHFQSSIAAFNEADFPADSINPCIGSLCGSSVNSWHLGMADTARAQIHEAISSAERMNRSVSLVLPLVIASALYVYLREPENLQKVAERLFTIVIEQQIREFVAFASIYRGSAMAEQGRIDEGIALIRDSLSRSGNRSSLPGFLIVLSEAHARAGQLEEALAAIDQAFTTVGEQQILLPGVLWQRGEVHLLLGDETSSAADFREAIRVAQRIGSKAFELRATTSLARLLAKQGKRDEARAMLADIYNWFTEGFDTVDLKDAKALLDELGR
jgi:class 3 adenylate cyclase/tetratricopeptide (TPR) repeat protein